MSTRDITINNDLIVSDDVDYITRITSQVQISYCLLMFEMLLLRQIHLVHYNSDKYDNVSHASSHVNDSSALAVLGVFVDVRSIPCDFIIEYFYL